MAENGGLHMPNRTLVPDKLQGYLLQVRHMLYELISVDDRIVSIEKLDDVAVEADGKVIAEQVKSVTSANNPIAERSSVFWKTLYNWCTYIETGALPSGAIMRFVVVSNGIVTPGSIQASFMNACSDSDAQKALADAKKSILGTAQDNFATDMYAEHHNCVFVGKDHAGQAKYAGLRGTYDRDGKGFRGDVTGSDKNVGFAIPHDPTSNQVRVFEAPIDLMSYLSLHRELINAVALCGLYDGALETYLKDNPHIKRITLCLDSDAPGRAAAQQLKDKYSARGYAVTVEEPRSGKDWNEYLQKRNTPERGR